MIDYTKEHKPINTKAKPITWHDSYLDYKQEQLELKQKPTKFYDWRDGKCWMALASVFTL